MKIKNMKIATFVIIVALCLSCMCISAFAATGMKAVGASVELNGTEAGFATVSISASSTIDIALFQGTWSVSELEGSGEYFKLKEISSSKFVFGANDNDANVTTGAMIWVDPSYAWVTFDADAQILTATYEVAANTPAGDYTVEFIGEAIGDADWNDLTESFTFTITVTEAATCDHSTTKLVPNNDGTHNVVCDNAECGEIVTPNVTCTGTDDGDCTTAVLCECGNTVTAAKTAHVAGADDGDCTTPVKCVNCDENAVEAKTHGHTNGFRYGDITATTHTKYCNDCNSAIEGKKNVAHDYTTGTSAYTCKCGAKFTGWDDDCYIQDAVMLKGWNEIEGAWYYLDPVTGYRAEGLTRVPYPTAPINGVTYAPNQEDIAYAANKGKTFIDEDEAWFVFDENGEFVQDTNLIDDDGTLRFAVNGCVVWHVGFVAADGDVYYFAGDAEKGGNKAVQSGFIYATRDYNSEKPVGGNCVYYFEGGYLAKNVGVVNIEGTLYYFDNNYMLARGAGLVEIEEGKYIFVRSAGQLAVGEYWVTPEKANGLVKGARIYVFDETGYMTSDVDKNGIVKEEDGNYYYYVEGVRTYAGLIEIDGDIYYVRTNGQLATGKYYVTKTNGMEGFEKGDKLYFGEDGKLEETKNGIVEEDGVLYYYENNRVLRGAGVVEMTDEEGKTFYIYVRSNGQLATGNYWPTTRNDLLESGAYNWGEDGRYYPAD